MFTQYIYINKDNLAASDPRRSNVTRQLTASRDGIMLLHNYVITFLRYHVIMLLYNHVITLLDASSTVT